MAFLVFILCIGALGFFHRREHEMFVRELRQMQPLLASEAPDPALILLKLQTRDWRMVRLEGMELHLRRAFQIADRPAALRYAVPVAILCVMLVFLQSFWLAGAYGLALALKWFASVTILDLRPAQPEYEVRLFGFRLFGEMLPKA